ncbi:MAG: YeeE/YedE thiosulfate transporter family protein [Deltaproteobacteria bacterium]
MTLDMLVRALLGGLLVGGASVGLLLANGRIAGISGITGGLLARPDRDTPWRASFLAGLLVGGVALRWADPAAFGPSPAGSPLVVALAGLLVGFGARLGSGCTSGHGVCGISRRSARSLVATLTFMATAAATVFAMRHGWAGR